MAAVGEPTSGGHHGPYDRTMTSRITGLRLTAFKSFRDVVVPLAPLTVLIGRNGSGKSNALDGLDVLHRLAVVGDVRDALEGARRDAAPVRGGIEGCAPFGSDSFALGVRVERANGEVIDLDVRVQVRPDVQVVWERLRVAKDVRAADNERWTVLMETTGAESARADIEASIWNGRRGRNPRQVFRATHLITTQHGLRLAGSTASERRIVETSDELLSVLGGLFHFDPVPYLMRQYVAERDVVLRTTGENLSAALAHLRDTDTPAFDRLVDVVKQLPEQTVLGAEVRPGGFGEVMLGLVEADGDNVVTVPARQLSDGMLRMIAILTAVLTSTRTGAATPRGADDPRTLLLEELENGLHPSQAALILGVVADAAERQGVPVVITTHSPALLNALPGDDHRGVVVIDRDPSSETSRATSLVALPGYHAVMATGGLGDIVSAGRLPTSAKDAEVDTTDLNRILGIG